MKKKKTLAVAVPLRIESSFTTSYEADFLFILKAQSSHPHSTLYPANVSFRDCYNI